MSIFDIDYDQFAETQSPPDKRTKKSLAWLRALINEVADSSYLRFNQYAKGSTDPLYAGGTYNRRNVVIFNYGVYESKIDGNTTDPTNTDNWRKISDYFIGARERLRVRSQVILLEYILNKWFSLTFRQPDTGFTSDIYITNNVVTTPVFVVGAIETESSVVFRDHSNEFIINDYSFAAQYNFTINVPITAYTALGVAAESIIRSVANRYVAAGITYNIVTYNNMIQTAKTTLTSAEILALFTTPKILVAAPGAGKVILPMAILIKCNYGTIDYATNTGFIVKSGIFYSRTLSGAIGVPNSSLATFSMGTAGAGSPVASSVNQPLLITAQSGNPTAGDSTFDIYITYETITL